MNTPSILRNPLFAIHVDTGINRLGIPIEKTKEVDFKNKNILLVGAGGIGTALSHYFLTEGVKKVRIHDVNNEKSEQLCEVIRN